MYMSQRLQESAFLALRAWMLEAMFLMEQSMLEDDLLSPLFSCPFLTALGQGCSSL